MSEKTPKLLFIFFAVACAVLRVYLKLTAVDPSTGFYEGGGIAVPTLNLLLVAGVAALLLLGLIQSRGRAARTLRLCPVCRALAALTGVSGAVFAAVFGAERLRGFELPGGSGANLLLLGLLLQFVAFFIAPLLSALYFLWIGLKGGEEGFSANGWLALAPLVWQIGLLLVTFMGYTAVRSVSDQMLTVVSMILIAPFLLSHARATADVDRSRGLAQLAAYGLPFALVSLTVSVGMLAALPAGRAVGAALGLPGAVFYLCAGLYAAALSFAVRREG